MLEQFISFINDRKLFNPKEKILLAVSGGVDSIVMTELFALAGFNFAIAHCNFQLRGKESDRDETFVKSLANNFRVRFFSKRFLTKQFAKENKLSIQEAARFLRYDWFQNISHRNKYMFIATAHHLDDSIETFFINLLRGTGISGLTGINPGTGDEIIRPLLFATKKEISDFAKKKKLKFHEDSSNAGDEYLRNRIRHQLIPVLQKLNPSFMSTMTRNLDHVLFADHVFHKAIIDEAVRLTHHVDNSPYFSRKEMQLLDFPVDYLYEFLSPFHFNAAQVREIWETRQSGKIFYSGNFRVICDRDKIIFSFQQKQDDQTFSVKTGQKSFREKNFSLKLQLITLKAGKKFRPEHDQSIAFLDASQLRFPLQIRKWNTGDSFYPLGMKHHKKLSDFFVDNKFSIPEKEKVYVLVSGDDIVCILGHRIDERYKVTDKTRKVFRIDYISRLK